MLAWVAGFVMCGFLLVRAAVCAACSWQLRIKVQRQGLHCTHLMQIGPVNIAVGWGLAGAGCQLTATGICRLKAMQLIPPVIAQCVQVLVGSGWRLCSCAAAMAA